VPGEPRSGISPAREKRPAIEPEVSLGDGLGDLERILGASGRIATLGEEKYLHRDNTSASEGDLKPALVDDALEFVVPA